MRNPVAPKRFTEANERRTQLQIERYLTVVALRRTWEDEKIVPIEMQIRNHKTILKLRAKERMVKNLLSHRSDVRADV